MKGYASNKVSYPVGGYALHSKPKGPVYIVMSDGSRYAIHGRPQTKFTYYARRGYSRARQATLGALNDWKQSRSEGYARMADAAQDAGKKVKAGWYRFKGKLVRIFYRGAEAFIDLGGQISRLNGKIANKLIPEVPGDPATMNDAGKAKYYTMRHVRSKAVKALRTGMGVAEATMAAQGVASLVSAAASKAEEK